MITEPITSNITGISTSDAIEDDAVQAKVDKYIEEMLSLKVHAEEMPSGITCAEESPQENTREEELPSGQTLVHQFPPVEFHADDFHTDELYTGEHHTDETHIEDPIHNAIPVYTSDRGYYIWYKESIPSAADTSIISDEYELLYQSVKRVEYKSRLNIYVASYTVCLAVVTIMLLTFPFLPGPLNDFHEGELTAAEYSVDKAIYVKPSEKINKFGENPYFNLNPFVQIIPENKPIAEVNKDQVNKQQENKQEITGPVVKPETKPLGETVEGMGRNSLGFTDLKNNVVYVLLPNGKYSIQESSWNNEEKAVSRINKLNSLGIKNPKGTILKAQFEKADIIDKGVWYRTRIGEFSSIKEAKQTAELIRTEEKSKSIASLFIFPGSNLKV